MKTQKTIFDFYSLATENRCTVKSNSFMIDKIKADKNTILIAADK